MIVRVTESNSHGRKKEVGCICHGELNCTRKWTEETLKMKNGETEITGDYG